MISPLFRQVYKSKNIEIKMAQVDNSIPLGFGGGLTRFKEEYDSKFRFSPNAVIVMIILAIAFVVGLKIFFPIAAA